MAAPSVGWVLHNATVGSGATVNSGVWNRPFPMTRSVTFKVRSDQALTVNVQTVAIDGTTWEDVQGATGVAIGAGEPVETIEIAHAASVLRLEMVNGTGTDASVEVVADSA